MDNKLKLPPEIINQISTFFHDDLTTISTLNFDDSFITAVQYVAKVSGISLEHLKYIDKVSLSEIARLGHFRFRQVELTGAWWNHDNGPLLGFFKENNEACVLLPKRNGYILLNPITLQQEKVTAETAEQLLQEGFYFYRTFPDEKLTLRNLIKFAMQGIRPSLIKILLLQLAIGLCSLLTPIATQNLFVQVIPDSDHIRLWQWLYALGVVALIVTALHLSQSLAVMHLRFKLNVSMQAALWDRIIRLPIQFFRQFTSGDLATRTDLIDNLQQMITSSILTNLINVLFIFMPLGLMAYYSLKLTIIVLVLMIIISIIYYCVTRLQIKYQRKSLELNGILSSWVLQFINSINKIRTSNAEESVFIIWLEKWFASLKNHYKANFVNVVLEALTSSFSIAIIVVIYAFVAYSSDISFGSFIGFNSAFGLFSVAFFSIVNMFLKISLSVSLYDRAKPILQAIPEASQSGIHPETIQGQIDVRNLSFQYQANHMILKDISLKVEAGSFTALVGLSGSGKSTLMRLLLGFEASIEGHILYDQIDLSKYDILALRRKLGVVLQNDVLFPGTIYENISAASHLSLEDAWEAARIVGLEDEIKAMPMGMHTLIVEGGTTISSGQRQRIIIARALAYNPQICIFDEATSHLDNLNQSLIHRNLSVLNITRVVIAQRLNTIIDADYIYVLDGGKLVQKGTFQELVNQKGLFANMAQKQGLA